MNMFNYDTITIRHEYNVCVLTCAAQFIKHVIWENRSQDYQKLTKTTTFHDVYINQWERCTSLVEMESLLIGGIEKSLSENDFGSVLWQFQVVDARVHWRVAAIRVRVVASVHLTYHRQARVQVGQTTCTNRAFLFLFYFSWSQDADAKIYSNCYILPVHTFFFPDNSEGDLEGQCDVNWDDFQKKVYWNHFLTKSDSIRQSYYPFSHKHPRMYVRSNMSKFFYKVIVQIFTPTDLEVMTSSRWWTEETPSVRRQSSQPGRRRI